MEEYFLFLDNLLEDEKKIISLKSFAMKFEIHVNKAINILDKYVEMKRKNKKSLFITYCICGEILSETNEKNFQIQLVSDEELQQAVSKYLPGCSYHIYSIQPCPIHSFTMLYNADIQINKQPSKSGAISLLDLELRKEPLCKVPIEILQKLNIKTDHKKQVDCNVSKQNIDESSDVKSMVDADASKSKVTSNTKMDNKIHSFFGKKMTEKESKVELRQPINQVSENKIDPVSSQCKPSTSKDKVEGKENKILNKDTKSKAPIVAVKKPVAIERKRKCILSSSEDEGSSSSADDDGKINHRNSMQLFESPEKINAGEEKIDHADSNQFLCEKEENNKVEVLSKDVEPNEGDITNSSRVATKRTLVRKTYVDEEGFMVTEKVLESAKMDIDLDLLKENPKLTAVNDKFPLKIDKNVDNVVEKSFKAGKVCTKPRQKLAINKQSTLNNFFKKT